MKKALHGFWRGGLLGGLLGLVGGGVLGLGLLLYGSIQLLLQGEFLELIADFEFIASIQIFLTLSGLMFGFPIGAVLGIPSIFYFDRPKTWQKVIGSIAGATLLHLLIVGWVYLNQQSFSYVKYLDLYLNWAGIVWPIYLVMAIIFGYYFPTFKPRWPKFLRKKQPQTE
jgi:hypothetical protein